MFADRELSMTARAAWPGTAGAVSSIASLAVLLLSGCQSPPTTLHNTCVEDWPEETAPFVAAPPLSDAEPEILWRSTIGLSVPVESLALSSGKLSFTWYRYLVQVDADTGAVDIITSFLRERITSVVYDPQGNAYFAGHNVYSLAPDGTYNWIAPLLEEDGEPVHARGRMVRDPRGDLYFSATDGHVYGVDGSDGTVRWRSLLTGGGQDLPVVVGGIGGALLAYAPHSNWRGQLWNAQTGEAMSYFTSPSGERYGAMVGPDIGIIAQRMEDPGGSYPWMHISALDECGKERFHLAAQRPQWPVLIGPGDQLYVVERDDYPGSPTAVSVYAPSGERVAGPVDMPIPWAIGADGTIFAVACDSSGVEGPARLYGYSQELQEQWMLPLGDGCPASAPVIDETGRLFFVWLIDNDLEMVAVQTTSPGLAATSWPARRPDALGAAWIQ